MAWNNQRGYKTNGARKSIKEQKAEVEATLNDILARAKDMDLARVLLDIQESMTVRKQPYSLGNRFLLRIQDPDGTVFGGYKDWK